MNQSSGPIAVARFERDRDVIQSLPVACFTSFDGKAEPVRSEPVQQDPQQSSGEQALQEGVQHQPGAPQQQAGAQQQRGDAEHGEQQQQPPKQQSGREPRPDPEQYDALLAMLRFGELSERRSPCASPKRKAAAAFAAASSAAGTPAVASLAALPAAAAAAPLKEESPDVTAGGALLAARDEDSPDVAAGTLMELGLFAALASSAGGLDCGQQRGAGASTTSAHSSGTALASGTGRRPSQESISWGHTWAAGDRQQPEPAWGVQAGGGRGYAAAALAAAAAAAAAFEEEDAEAARRGRRVRAAKRKGDDVAEGSDLEEAVGLGAGEPSGAGGRGSKRRRGPKDKAPIMPKRERKFASNELSLEIFESEGCFNMRLDDAARHLGFGSPTSIKKAMTRLNIIKWPNRTRETAKNILAGLQEYLARYCDAGTTAAVMSRAQARLQPYLVCITSLELAEDLRKLRQKVYKLRDQDNDPAYAEANMRKCVERLVDDVMGQAFADGPPPKPSAS